MSTEAKEFWSAIQNGDTEAVSHLLKKDKLLVGKNFEPDSLYTNGFPLYHASKQATANKENRLAYAKFLQDEAAKK